MFVNKYYLHGDVNVQTQNLVLVFIEHFCMNSINTTQRLDTEFSTLLNRDLTLFLKVNPTQKHTPEDTSDP